MTDTLMSKYCSKCDKTKLVSEFYRNAQRGDGLSGYCKVCSLAMTKESQARTRERIGEDAWRERQREATNRYRSRNPGLKGAYNIALKRLREAHPDEFDKYYEEAKSGSASDD